MKHSTTRRERDKTHKKQQHSHARPPHLLLSPTVLTVFQLFFKRPRKI